MSWGQRDDTFRYNGRAAVAVVAGLWLLAVGIIATVAVIVTLACYGVEHIARMVM